MGEFGLRSCRDRGFVWLINSTGEFLLAPLDRLSASGGETQCLKKIGFQ
jgi:hypothetical protein